MVRCADCQFLSLGNRFTGRLDKAGRDYRATGEVPVVKRPSSAGRGGTPSRRKSEFPYTNIPACYIGVRDLGAPFADDDLGDPQSVLAYLNEERECGAFVRSRPVSTEKHRAEGTRSSGLLARLAAERLGAVIFRFR